MALSKINTNSIADDAVTTAKVNPAQTDITSVGTLTSFASTGIDDNADANAITIDSSERVIIGATSITATGDADNLQVVGSAETGISITGGTSNTTSLVFGDTDDTTMAAFTYHNADNSLRTTVNNYERMRVASNGMIEIMTQNTGSYGAAINFGYRTTDFYAVTTSDTAEKKKGGFAHFRKGGPDLDQTTNHFSNPRSDGWSMFYLAKLDDGGSDSRYFDFYWNTSSASSIGSIKGNGSNIAYNTSSDYRLKENVVDSNLDTLYSQVKSLKVKTYNFIRTPDITQHGFLAHEAKDVWDYVCDTPKDAMKDDLEGGTKDSDGNPAKVPDYQELDYGKFTPMIMGALQKAMEKIETLESEVAKLKEA